MYVIVEHCGNVHVITRHYQCMSIYRDFAEISWCPDYVNLQRFYGARLCQFTEILWCPDYVNLQRFCRDFIVPRLCQFTEILWCPDYVNLQRFYMIRLNL